MTNPPPSDWLPDRPDKPSREPKKEASPGKQLLGCGFIVFLVIILLAACNAVSGNESEPTDNTEITETTSTTAPEDDTEDILGWSRAEARRACHDQIKSQLKAPGTASFEGLFNTQFTKTNGGTIWSIRGYVDAENSYGGEIRNGYRCTVRPTSEDSATVRASLQE